VQKRLQTTVTMVKENFRLSKESFESTALLKESIDEHYLFNVVNMAPNWRHQVVIISLKFM
jgi:hypothetical protein